MHDGSHLFLKKLDRDYNPTDRRGAIDTILKANAEKQFLTGLLYIDEQKPDFTSLMHVDDAPLATLPQSMVRPPKSALDEIMESLK